MEGPNQKYFSAESHNGVIKDSRVTLNKTFRNGKIQSLTEIKNLQIKLTANRLPSFALVIDLLFLTS